MPEHQRRKAWVGGWRSRKEKGEVQLKDELGGCSSEEERVEVELTLQSRLGRVTISHVSMLWTRFCRSP